MGLGYLQGYTHDYLRHGTTTLFAALDVATGSVMAQCKKRHRHQEFLQFLRHIDANVPSDLEVHLVVDNYATHKHPKVRLWMARNPRFHFHFTPTYSSWLNQVEIWFGIITNKAIRRGSFSSVKELVERIDQFVQSHNQNSDPFAWTATADSIFEKLSRLCERISGTPHYVDLTFVPSPRAITPLCDSIGEKLVANYDISWFQWLGILPRQPMWRCGDDAMTEPFLGRVACSKQGVVGPFDEDPCLGRCGPGCTDLFVVNDKVFSRECFTHDVCVGGTGDSPLPLCLFGGPWCGPCANEFLAAVDSFFTGDPCPPEILR